MRELRWRLFGFLLSYAFLIAPRGEARDRLIDAIERETYRIHKGATDKVSQSSD